jgi:nitroreductase
VRRSALNIYTAISTRRSVRAFQDREVPETILTRILEATRLAPSASNRQEWRFVVVRDRGTRKSLARAANGQRFVGEAPVVIACCAETDGHVMSCGLACFPIDVAIAVDHLTLCAAAEGLGTCWIGAFDPEQVKEILGIPPGIRVVALLPLGYPEDPAPVKKARRPIDSVVKYERW